MDTSVTVQRIASRPLSPFERARKYYAIMSVVNNINLTPTETKLLVFMALHGTISQPETKEAFCREHKSTTFSVNNIVYDLRKKGILIKNDNKDVVLNPRIVVDFSGALVLNITLTNGAAN